MTSLSSPLTPRFTPFLLTLLFISYQILLLQTLTDWISKAQDDEADSGWRKLEAVKAVLLIWRVIAVGGVALGLKGLHGIYKESTTSIRLFVLHSFSSILADLTFLLLLLIVLSTSSHSSTTFSSSLCETISNADLSASALLDFGWNIENCEDQWKSVFGGISLVVAIICGARVWMAIKLLEYYRSLLKRGGGQGSGGLGSSSSGLRRKPSLSIKTRSIERYSDSHSPSSAKQNSGTGGQKIFLLPNTMDETSTGGDLGPGGNEGIPMVNLMAATPNASNHPSNFSFPPAAQNSTDPPSFLVYAPVQMTADQARSLQAREVMINPYSSATGSYRARSRSYSSPAGPPSSVVHSAAPSLSGMLSGVIEEERRKGKLA